MRLTPNIIEDEPIAGAWYLSPTGKFIRVMALVHDSHNTRVVINPLGGERNIVDLAQWWALNLERYPLRQRRAG